MVKLLRVKAMGNLLAAEFDDGATTLCYPTAVPVWIASGTGSGTPDPDPDPDPDPGPGDIYNPWLGWSVTGTWDDHASYSLGGIDRPLGYNTPLYAPANGTVVSTTWVDAAGRRTQFNFDNTYPRLVAASGTLMNGVYYEASGPMVSLVLQHQASFVATGHYNKGQIIGYSGASASPGSGDYGGDVHLHYHGLDSGGNRLNFDKFVA